MSEWKRRGGSQLAKRGFVVITEEQAAIARRVRNWRRNQRHRLALEIAGLIRAEGRRAQRKADRRRAGVR